MILLKTLLAFLKGYDPGKQVQRDQNNLEAYGATRTAESEIDGKALAERFGLDFCLFLYRPQLYEFINKTVVPVLYPAEKHDTFLDHDHWKEKHPFNFPGPFYTGESDTCCTGHIEAPDNVLYDANGQEYIFRQPGSYVEFIGTVNAAAVEVFDSYSCNGSDHWTHQRCKEWWQNKPALLKQLNDPEIREVNGDRISLYIDYLGSSAEHDLRRYCYFLEHGIYPADDGTPLPDV
jgi:hypothetical protein